jgi:hypothetical protein
MSFPLFFQIKENGLKRKKKTSRKRKEMEDKKVRKERRGKEIK